MKILINSIPLLSPLTGVGKYTYNIARSLAFIDNINDYTYYYGYFSKKLISFSKKDKILLKFKELILSRPYLKKLAYRFKRFALPLEKEYFDIYFEPNFIPLSFPAKRIVVTVHDFSFYHHPEWHPAERVEYFQRNFWENIKKADKIICVSQYIKNEAINIFNLPPDKIDTIYHGINKEVYHSYEINELKPIMSKYSLPSKFIFFLGSIEPRKNIKNLLLAYLDLEKNLRREFKLILAGYKGWKNEEIFYLIKKSDGDAKFIGYIPEEDLAKIFNLAYLFVFPSFYEGFGLPPLEAMACGCPVIVSNTSSLPEICGDAAYYINPKDVNNLINALHEMINCNDLRQSLVNKGFQKAAQFSWQDSALKHLSLFLNLSS